MFWSRWHILNISGMIKSYECDEEMK